MKRLHIEFDLIMPDVKTYNVTAYLALQQMIKAIDSETHSVNGTTEIKNLKIRKEPCK